MLEYDKNSWSTPDYIVSLDGKGALNKEFDFVLDAAASDINHKCAKYLTIDDNSLQTNWRSFVGKAKSNNEAVWLNPPYGKGLIKPFIEKALSESVTNSFTVVILIPNTPDAGWWPEFCAEKRSITKGRISFVHPETGKPINGNTKGSALLVFRPLANYLPTIYREVTRQSLQLLAQNELAGAKA